jgi:hypothetical protein
METADLKIFIFMITLASVAAIAFYLAYRALLTAEIALLMFFGLLALGSGFVLSEHY